MRYVTDSSDEVVDSVDSEIMMNQKLKEISYFIFFALILFAKGVGLYDGQKIFYLFLIPAVLFWCVKMVLTRYNIIELCAIGLLIVLGGLTWRIGGDKTALVTVMVVTGIKDIKIEKLFKVSLGVWTISFFGTIIAYAMKLHGTVLFVHNKLGGFWLRDSLGQTHPNVLHVCYLVLVALWFLVFKFKGKKLVLTSIVALLGGVYLYLFSWSNTGFLMLFAFLFAVNYFEVRGKISERLTKFEYVGLQLLFPIFTVLSMILPIFPQDGTKFFAFLYKLTNTRSYLTQLAYKNIPIEFFGTQIVDMPKSFSIDCSFVYGLFHWGLPLFILSMVGTFFLIRYLIREHRYTELSMTLAFLFGGITEQFLYNFSFKNLIWILLGEYMFVVLNGLNAKLNDKRKVMLDSGSAESVGSNELFGLNDGVLGSKLIVTLDNIAGRIESVFATISGVVGNWWKAIVKHRVIILVVGVVGAIAGLAIGCATIHEPKYLVVNREKSSYVDGKFYYLIYGELEDEIKNNSRKIDINSDAEKCYVFEGETVEFTENRERSSAACAGAVILMAGVGAIFTIKEKRERL